MADTKLADLTALTTPSGDDILYIVDDPAGTPLDRKIALDNLFTRGTITADAPVLNMSQTWNNAAVTFTGLKFNVTDTASNASSLLMDLGTGGGTFASKFSVSRAGVVTVNADTATSAANPAIALTFGNSSKSGLFQASNVFSMQVAANGVEEMSIGNGPVRVTSTSGFGWVSGASTIGAADTILSRRGAANLRLGAADAAAPVAQTLSVQSVVAGTTNIAGANLTITGSQGTGTGAGGSIIFQVAPAGSSGSAQNALVDALTIASNRSVTIAAGSATLKRGLTANYLIYENAGLDVFQVTGGEFNLVGNALLTWGTTNNTFTGYTADVILRRDAANTLALRNGANAQAFNIYNTTDGTNAEWVKCYWTSNKFIINTQGSGTGNTSRVIELQCGGGAKLNVNPGDVTVTGALLMAPDNTYDIGASGASRPRSVYAGTSITPGRGVTVAGLPTPSTGMIARVTDATAPVIGATVAGGGAAYALVNYNGANWTVIGV